MSTRDELDDRLLDPVAVDRHLQGADLAAIATVFERARGRGQRAWMTMAVCVGRAQAQGGRGDAVIERMADIFHLHRSRIARLGRIYREVIRPRLESSSAPSFSLAEQAWYEIATEASGPLGRSTIDLLAEAEERKRADPRYSTRRWKSDLGITAADAGSVKLRGLLVRLVGVEDDAVEEFAQGDADQNTELLLAAARVIDRAARSARLSMARPFWRAIVDEHGDLVVEDVSPELAAQLGHTPAEMIGCSIFDFIWNPERARTHVELLAKGERPSWVRDSFEPGHFEFRHASGAKAILPLDYIVRSRSDGSLDGLEMLPIDPAAATPRQRAPASDVGPHDRWILDVHGKTVWVSDAIASALGETGGSMLGAYFWEFQPDPPRVQRVWEELVRDPRSSPEPARLAEGLRRLRRRSDGVTTDLGLELTMLVRSDGSWQGVLLGPPLDLLREQLAFEVERTEPPAPPETVDRALAVWVIDSGLRTVFVSPEISSSLATTPETMVGRSALDYSPEPESWRRVFDLMRGGLTPPWTPGWQPGAIRVRDGRARIVEMSLQLTRHYSPMGEFLGVTLYASATAVPDEAPTPTVRPARDGMWIIRANDFETLFVSPEIAEILGSTREEMIGRSALPFLTVAGDTVRATNDLKRSEVLWAGHAGLRRFVRRDGTAVTLHAESHPVYDARGQLTHVAAVFAAGSLAPPPVEQRDDQGAASK
jgi:PAS domain S-box-containing protein